MEVRLASWHQLPPSGFVQHPISEAGGDRMRGDVPGEIGCNGSLFRLRHDGMDRRKTAAYPFVTRPPWQMFRE
jgi:hypothetical protein